MSEIQREKEIELIKYIYIYAVYIHKIIYKFPYRIKVI